MANNLSLSHHPNTSLPPPKRKSETLHPPLEHSKPASRKRRNGAKEEPPVFVLATETMAPEIQKIDDGDDDDDEDEGGGYLRLEKVIDRFEEITKDPLRVQKETLKKILEQNKEAEYLRNLGLNGSSTSDPESFKARVPLVTYSKLRPYVDRIFSGESSGVLTTKPVTAFSLSSGTSEGKPKRVPFTEELIDAYVQSMITSYAYRNREYPIDESKMCLQFLYISEKTRTPDGIDVGLVSAHLITHPKFNLSYRAQRCSPDEILWASDKAQALYCHLLMGLKFRKDIQYVYAVFAHSLVGAFKSLEQVWEDLCRDIRDGSPNASRITDPKLHAAVSARMGGPDPDAARELRGLCDALSRKRWEGLVPTLFPNAKYLLAVMTGTAEHYLGRLRVYADHLPLKGVDYGATEGWVGTNVRPKVAPEDICFVPIPNVAYFEFILLDSQGDGRKPRGCVEPVGLTEVKVGHMYEVVLTNFQGMYRYRLGDWVKVTGFYNSTPEFKYICRGNVMLSIHIDKTTEKDLQAAVDTASRHLPSEKVELVDFTSYAESTPPGNERYVIYWELHNHNHSSTNVDAHNNYDKNVSVSEALQRCCSCLDASFEDLGYKTSRQCGSIGPLELRIVRSGTFKKVREDAEVCSGGVQFKMPRCVKNEAVLKILGDNVARSYFSTAYVRSNTTVNCMNR